jgi:hypothetical protein
MKFIIGLISFCIPTIYMRPTKRPCEILLFKFYLKVFTTQCFAGIARVMLAIELKEDILNNDYRQYFSLFLVN